ncbi:hypothetical protein A2690_04790 [Candidatus Roizmanbacteria bacterium RIFCSPHIGHO2_01_FULL_39_12b]|uniref:Large ribosomal subunit protein bL25 n=1 Tax=Candidatus Roizmanbacteria bacterium RIFCSPHIGHO2_01_FULL_39_12b TaxID=1802030 RepID=A0A1F7GDY5_9BACT|nr:MAG: hypothetical protein A2690_04790 [Candidatus Roizmanbacteria bacterium RIFCSPHIGHO2_01_FULL_39_12b]OGK46061.1 MAG: hypothetical protein A3B46_00900 [Candidatus Roizmanbacteria bacterium RIFCSPLOWO2_01_FULL_39_19]
MEKSKKEKIELNAHKRDILGKKVKKLRAEEKLPANIFGAGFTSQSIWMELGEFKKIYKIAGVTQVVYVTIDKMEYPTIIDTVQKHPITHDLLHVNFKKVNLKQKIETEVPIQFVGESGAVEKKKGDMLTLKDTLLVRALPDAIPSQIEIDISILVEIDDEITLGQLTKSDDFELIEEAETTIVRIVAHKEESIEPDTTAEIPEEEAGVETTEGETPAEEPLESKDESSKESEQE